MSLKATLDNLDGIPESQHEFYKQVDGAFVLQIDGVDDHPAVVSLKNAHKNSKTERNEALEKLKDAEKRLADLPEDFDADDYTRLRAEAEARESDPDNKDIRKQIEDAVNAQKKVSEAALNKLKDKYEGELGELREVNTRLDGSLRTTKKTDALTRALQEAKVKPELFDAVSALHDRNVEVVEEEGNFVVKAKADLGGDDVGTFIKNWAQTDHGKPFIDPARGSDAPGSRGGRGQPGKTGDWGGSKDDRKAAISNRFNLPA